MEETSRLGVGWSALLGLGDDSIALQYKVDWNPNKEIPIREGSLTHQR